MQFVLAEREGFEPPVPLDTTVFKTASISHSDISPSARKQYSKSAAVCQPKT